MIERSTNPAKFASWFNSVVPGAYRKITTQDIRDMETCGLIRRHGGYYHHTDLEMVRGILQYEQMREKRSAKEAKEDEHNLPSCKMCGLPLPIEPEGKKGRPREHCSNCELFRNKERNRKWRKIKKGILIKSASSGD